MLLERRLELLLAPAAAVQALARQIDGDRCHAVGVDVHVDADVGAVDAHRGALAQLVAHAVDDRVLGLERAVVRVPRVAVAHLRGREVHGDGLARAQVIRPRDRLGALVEGLLVGRLEGR